MYATVDVSSEPIERAVTVPREAIIDTGTRQIAFVALGGGHFEPRTLKLGSHGRDGVVQVLQGLAPGEQVVTSGQFLLDSESRLKEAINKHLNAGLLATNATKPTGSSAAVRAASTKPAVVVQVDDTAQKELDNLAAAYLTIAKELGATQKQGDAPPVPVEGVVKAATTLSKALGGDEAKSVVDSAQAMQGKPIAEQRDRFAELSAAVIPLFERTPPSAAVAEKLYVANCPWPSTTRGRTGFRPLTRLPTRLSRSP